MLPMTSDSQGNIFALNGRIVRRRDAGTFVWQNIHELPEAEYVGVAVSGTILVCVKKDGGEEALLGVAAYTPILVPPPADDGARAIAGEAKKMADGAAGIVAKLADDLAALARTVDALPTRADVETQAQARSSEAVRAIIEEARTHHNELRTLIGEVVGEAPKKARPS